MFTRCVALAIAIGAATTAYGGTMQEAYERLWLKRAIDVSVPNPQSQKPKAACVCVGAPVHARMGVLLKVNDVGLCGIPNFDGATGNVISWSTCSTFEYIGK
jgi:hypothetical protein